jgi:hypothetical protein
VSPRRRIYVPPTHVSIAPRGLEGTQLSHIDGWPGEPKSCGLIAVEVYAQQRHHPLAPPLADLPLLEPPTNPATLMRCGDVHTDLGRGVVGCAATVAPLVGVSKTTSWANQGGNVATASHGSFLRSKMGEFCRPQRLGLPGFIGAFDQTGTFVRTGIVGERCLIYRVAGVRWPASAGPI